MAGKDLAVAVLDHYNKPKLNSDLIIIDTLVDMPDSQYSYKLGVHRESGKQFIIEENRFLKTDVDNKIKHRMIPASKKNIQNWKDMYYLSSNSKHELVKFLDDNFSTGRKKVKELYKFEDLVKFLDNNDMLGSVLRTLQDENTVSEIKTVLDDLDKISKNPNLSVDEKKDMIREKQYGLTDDMDNLELWRIFEEGEDSLARPTTDVDSPTQSRHWLDDSAMKPDAVKKIQHFEKNKLDARKKALRKVLTGKDELVNYLYENRQLDKVLKQSVEVDDGDYFKYINDLEQKRNDIESNPNLSNKNKKKMFRESMQENFSRLNKLPVSDLMTQVRSSNLNYKSKESISFMLEKYGRGPFVSDNIESLMNMKGGKFQQSDGVFNPLDNFRDAHALTDYLGSDMDILSKLAQGTPEDFHKGLNEIDNWRTQTKNKPGHYTFQEHMKDVIENKLPSVAAAEGSKPPGVLTELERNFKFKFSNNDFKGLKTYGNKKWNNLKKSVSWGWKNKGTLKGTKAFFKKFGTGLDYGMQVAGFAMCMATITMAAKNENEIADELEKQEKELSQAESDINKLLINGTKAVNALTKDYKDTMKIFWYELAFVSANTQGDKSETLTNVRRAIDATIGEEIITNVLQGKDYSYYEGNYKTAVELMQRFNKILQSKMSDLQQSLRGLLMVRQVERDASVGVNVENIIKRVKEDELIVDGSFNDFSVLLILSKSEKKEIKSKMMYNNYPLVCIRNQHIKSKTELDSWMSRSSAGENILAGKLENFILPMKPTLEMMLMLMKV